MKHTQRERKQIDYTESIKPWMQRRKMQGKRPGIRKSKEVEEVQYSIFYLNKQRAVSRGNGWGGLSSSFFSSSLRKLKQRWQSCSPNHYTTLPFSKK